MANCPETPEINDEMFAQLVQFCNHSDNRNDNAKRAELLGFGGRDVLIAPGAIVRVRNKESIGSDVFIGLYSYVNGNVIIGDHVLIGPHCSLTAGHHKFDPKTQAFTARTENDYDNTVRIGDGCWLAANVVITAGVTVGKANLICANAVVTKDTPDYAIMAGVPAKQIGRIDPVTGEYVYFK